MSKDIQHPEQADPLKRENPFSTPEAGLKRVLSSEEITAIKDYRKLREVLLTLDPELAKQLKEI